jgi:hypothetical protein
MPEKIRTQNINRLLGKFSILKTSKISPISILSRIFRMHTFDGNPNEIHIDRTNTGKNPTPKEPIVAWEIFNSKNLKIQNLKIFKPYF